MILVCNMQANRTCYYALKKFRIILNKHMMNFYTIKISLIYLISLISLASSSFARAEEDINVVNWYYSTMFGTGYYKVGDANVGIIRFPFSYTFKTIRENKDEYGLKLLIPVSTGFYSFDFNDLLDLPNNVATLSVVPGLEFEYLVNKSWVLMPYINAGLGKEFNQNIWSWIYGAGVKSRWVKSLEEGEFTLGNSVNYAGYYASDSSNRAMVSFVSGLNWVAPLEFTLFKRSTNIGTHLIYYGYLNELDFVDDSSNDLKVRHEIEFAITLGTHKPRSFLGFDFSRYGLGFRVGKNVRAIRLVTDFSY